MIPTTRTDKPPKKNLLLLRNSDGEPDFGLPGPKNTKANKTRTIIKNPKAPYARRVSLILYTIGKIKNPTS